MTTDEGMKFAYISAAIEESPYWDPMTEEEAEAIWDEWIARVKRDAAREAVPALLDALKQAEADRDWLFHSSRLAKKERIKANARAERAEARIEAVERLALAADDGTEYEHNGHDPTEGEAECPGCWALGIRRALDGDA